MKELIEKTGPGDLLLMDRNFCTCSIISGTIERGGHFLVREHAANPNPTEVSSLKKIGRIETGMVYEQMVSMKDEKGHTHLSIIMNTNDAQTWAIVLLVLLALVAVAWLITRRRQSRHLQKRFGPEYRHVVAERGDRTKAEAELRARERRVERLKLIPLTPTDAARFGDQWNGLQTRFVDDPKGAVAEADPRYRGR